AGLISAIFGEELPGPGSIYLGQTLRFLAPVYLGDTVTAKVEVTGMRSDKPIATNPNLDDRAATRVPK
ncbi:unnamed protein product, partial [marine sediment metagenome]